MESKLNKIVFIKYSLRIGVSIRVMVFNATFNNISVISWRSVLLVDGTRVAGENHYLPDATLSHIVVSSEPHHELDSNSQLYW